MPEIRLQHVPEHTDQPCNICGRGWPYHETVCAYVGNVRDLQAAQAEVERLRALLLQACDIAETALRRNGIRVDGVTIGAEINRVMDLRAALSSPAGGDTE